MMPVKLPQPQPGTSHWVQGTVVSDALVFVTDISITHDDIITHDDNTKKQCPAPGITELDQGRAIGLQTGLTYSDTGQSILVSSSRRGNISRCALCWGCG